MENVFDAVDHLRNRLGVFYWTLQHEGDRERAAEQLRDAIAFAETNAPPPPDCLSFSLFQRWEFRQLHSLLEAAKQALERLGFAVGEKNQPSGRNAPAVF
jgi:hypothetical protein